MTLIAMVVVLLGLLMPGSVFADGATEGVEAAVVEVAAAAEETPTLDSGHTAWMITATALVLFMTLPGLALFYGGLVRAKNVLTILVQCFALAAIMSILWVVYGYSLAFESGGGLQKFIGGFGKLFLSGVTRESLLGDIPETVFTTFQMTFAIITPALIVGAFAERMKFSAMLIFSVLWFTFSYLPICHMAWGGDGAMFADWGVLDFAGGTVVHINAGIAGLVACIMLGKRKGFGSEPLPPHSVPFTIAGAAILWVGWFGFNAGSELAADGTSGMALLVTQVATATAAATWMFVEWMRSGKPTAVGIATGAVAGLVAITPASGTAGPIGGLLIGFASGLICYFAATSVKRAMGYDDSLDVFGVHGVGGIVGALLTGLCAAEWMGGSGISKDSVGGQIGVQFLSIVVTIIWSAVVSVIALSIAKAMVGLRVSEEVEHAGLDLAEHGEEGYHSHGMH
ncbi:MAG TPA: ammonium transporter [Verrucomicrobia bacterium]|nr:ammonium transporter [Verrucomicrobiota bacterium]HOP97172.1 ammonium transporter [Verrucomicrobiota bacterium]